MSDMSKFKKEFPSQTKNRRIWVQDSIRGNPVAQTFLMLVWKQKFKKARVILNKMYGMDRTALLQPGGVLTKDEIESCRQIG